MTDAVAASTVWDAVLAQTYDRTHVDSFLPTVVDPAVDVLAQLAGGEPALEFAVGDG